MEPMSRALSLARKALGTTSPNPPVGAVLVRDGVVVGEGHTLPPGQAHAEIVALEQAGALARGASLYVTLEPCCTWGRTGPCTTAITTAGVAQVHMAVDDPNPKVSGGGRSLLEAAGIPTVCGEGKDEATHLYRYYTKHISTGLPYVIAKFASSLDGRIATSTGDSRWITGPSARERGQELRREVDAILVGVNTVLKDDPLLTARGEDGATLPRQPLRVVVDSRLRTPPSARLLAEPGRTIIATTQDAGVAQGPGIETLAFSPDHKGRVPLGQLMASLGQRGVVSLLAEGGGQALGSLFDEGLVDEVRAFIAPMVIGGVKAPPAVAGVGPLKLADALRLSGVTVERCGEDILVTGFTDSWREGRR